MPSDRSDRVYLLIEEDLDPPWREYVIGVYFDRERAHAERKRRQAEEDAEGAYAQYRYTLSHHWVSDAHAEAAA